MSDLAARIPEDIKTAMKAKDAVTLNALRALKTAMMNVSTSAERSHQTGPLDDAEVTSLIRKQIKQRQDSYEQFTKAGREELAATETAEIAVLEKYLPAAMTAEEIAALVDAVVTETGAASKADMGKVMKLAQERAAGRADGKTLSQEVAKRLS
ncbi:GatB/YqeY domain-containing protein [Luteolibacter arcticus]|uniref:GatB/YqeY domain-containing protein n=1 Tax=Luteolibacter arcticus TaxID=1581411 RepID=A0ABT3GC92_9BACT|nr:GatB/YqeY domain-containing protein [Luteolibacter arcticus]MCW1921232.1 GatB/YqeY domain-containing protein [Luteolibacter arcticus]